MARSLASCAPEAQPVQGTLSPSNASDEMKNFWSRLRNLARDLTTRARLGDGTGQEAGWAAAED